MIPEKKKKRKKMKVKSQEQGQQTSQLSEGRKETHHIYGEVKSHKCNEYMKNNSMEEKEPQQDKLKPSLRSMVRNMPEIHAQR